MAAVFVRIPAVVPPKGSAYPLGVNDPAFGPHATPKLEELGIKFVVLTVETVPVPTLPPPSSNLTVPVGVTPPVFTKLENVTDCPDVVGLVFELTCETVTASLTTTLWVTCGAAA